MNLDKVIFTIVMVLLAAFLVVAIVGVLVCAHVITGPTWLVNV
jgi:hypothetical protein